MDNMQKIKHIKTKSLSGYQHKLQVVIENDIMRVPKNDGDINFFNKRSYPEKDDEQSDYYFPHIAKNELGFDVPLSGIVKRVITVNITIS